MKLFIGADHRGFTLKEFLKEWLVSQNHDVVDCGNTIYDSEDDYPIFAFAVAEAVAKDRTSVGIILCGSGGGVTIAANKVAGIRAAVGESVADIKHNREHNDINVLALAADAITKHDAQVFVTTFLQTVFNPDPKYQRRLLEIHQKETS